MTLPFGKNTCIRSLNRNARYNSETRAKFAKFRITRRLLVFPTKFSSYNTFPTSLRTFSKLVRLLWKPYRSSREFFGFFQISKNFSVFRNFPKFRDFFQVFRVFSFFNFHQILPEFQRLFLCCSIFLFSLFSGSLCWKFAVFRWIFVVSGFSDFFDFTFVQVNFSLCISSYTLNSVNVNLMRVKRSTVSRLLVERETGSDQLNSVWKRVKKSESKYTEAEFRRKTE